MTETAPVPARHRRPSGPATSEAAGCRPWILLLPLHLGDGLCAALLLDKIRSAPSAPAAIDIVTSAAMRPLFGRLRGVRRAFAYETLHRARLPDYSRLLDLLGNDISAAAARRVRAERRIVREADEIRVRDGEGRLLHARPAPTFRRAGRGRAARPDLPIWMLNAPTVAAAVGGSPWAWLAAGYAPVLRFRGGSRRDRALRDGAGPPRVVLVPCGAEWQKHWPEEGWRALLGAAAREGWRTTLVLGPREAGRYAGLRTAAAGPRDAVELVDAADLPRLAGLLAAADLVIANDCGPMHLAAAQGTPVIALFGPTDRHCWFPYRGAGQIALQEGDGPAPWRMIDTADGPWPRWPAPGRVLAAARGILGAI